MTDPLDTTRMREVLARLQSRLLTLRDEQIELHARLMHVEDKTSHILEESRMLLQQSNKLTELIGFEDSDWQKVANRFNELKTKEKSA